jgi:hypothetical protein
MKVNVILWLTITASASAWHGEGHIRASRLAVAALEDGVPLFFREGVETIAHCSVDPDVFKFYSGSGLLRDDEIPEHFFDLELFTESTLPEDRMDFFFWCLRNGIYIQKIGTLPYALGEATERLAVAFAEYRHWPGNPAVQAKCLVYAGHLAHYAQDLCQPLHTTIHYDGRVGADGCSPRTGLHARVDALLGKLDPNPAPILTEPSITAYDDFLSAVLLEIAASHELVDRVYELEQQLDALPYLDPQGEVAAFARERWAASARVTANCFLTAWAHSEWVEIPDWHSRPLALQHHEDTITAQ